jgi:hypothetical protein
MDLYEFFGLREYFVYRLEYANDRARVLLSVNLLLEPACSEQTEVQQVQLFHSGKIE